MCDIQSISKMILTNQNFCIKDILQKISNDYNIDYQELLDKYVSDSISTCKTICKSKCKLQPHEQCCAKKQDGMRCTRRHKEESRFCGKHENNLKFGQIEENETDGEVISTTRIYINDKSYLVDNNNIVYSDDINNPEVIGKCKKNFNSSENKYSYEIIKD